MTSIKKCLSKIDRRIIMQIIVGILFLIICAWTIYPTLKIATYSYPVHDDFAYMSRMRDYISQGHSVGEAVWYQTGEFYKHFVGAYSSSIMGYYFEHIIQCQPKPMALFEIGCILLFDVVLAVWLYAILSKIFRFSKLAVLGTYAVMLTFINNVVYYPDAENYYWLITSIQYLLLLVFALLGNLMTIFAIKENNRAKSYIFLGVATLCGFWAAGGNLILVFLNASLSFLIVVMLGVTDKFKKMSLIPICASAVGSVINGLAPGNYERMGYSKTFKDAIKAGLYSCKYAYERIEMMFSNPIFIIALVVLILLLMFHCNNMTKLRCGYKYPLVVVVLLMGFAPATIFPGILGYGYDTYGILMRGNFLSDFMIYCMMLLSVVYFVGWIKYKYFPERELRIAGDVVLLVIVFIAITLFRLRDNAWRWTPTVRMYREISSGRMEEYSDYVWSILNQVKDSEDEAPCIFIDEIEDKTCMINPLFLYGDHEPKTAFFYSLADYYGKEDVFLYNQSEKD